MDIFGGTGGVGKAVAETGVQSYIIDLVYGYDLLSRKGFAAVKSLLARSRRGRPCVRGVCLASPCETFSAARRAPMGSRLPRRLRSAQHPCGFQS